jgi:hypothetical protein
MDSNVSMMTVVSNAESAFVKGIIVNLMTTKYYGTYAEG